jgi:predicted nucleic acid-binding protein
LSVVLDANALVVLALDRRRAVAVETLLRTWKAEQQDLHAPALLRYEIASARPSPPARLPLAEVAGAWERITAVPVTLHNLDDALSVVEVTQALRRKSAYDAVYVALAQALGATAVDPRRPLARNAQSLGLPVVLIETD